MLHYDYFIVSGGMTADAAVTVLAARDPQGQIGLISAESDPPYDRPPLTKGLWKDQDLRSVWRKSARAGATPHLNRRVERLDVDEKQEEYRKGVIYYLRDGRVRGVLLWKVWGQVSTARKLLAESGPFEHKDLRGRLPA